VVSNIGKSTIKIYIHTTDDHHVYSPMDGTLTNIVNRQDSWTSKIFTADVNKIARILLNYIYTFDDGFHSQFQ
jgi:hypothetical protein